MLIKPIVVVLAVALASCATLQTEERTLQTHWDSSSAARVLQSGGNSIKGNAFMRQQGGGVVSCAGQTVKLIPATSYAIERMGVLYGGGESGFNRGRSIKFTPDPPEYYSLTKSTKCDSQGNFLFEGVADGEYFVIVTVQWTVGYSTQGGNLMHRVQLRGGSQASIIMSA